MQVIVRPYTSDDVDATITIFLRAIREVSSQDYSPEQIAAWAQVEDRQAWSDRRSGCTTWIAQVNDAPAGFADLTSDGLLDMMFVHPDFQRRGVASSLLATVQNEAGRLGLTRIYTEASKTARPFFETKGFHIVKTQQVVKRGQVLENYLMQRLQSLPAC